MRTVEYLDAIALAQGLDTDYKIGKVLGIKSGAIANYRHHGGTFDNVMALKVARLLEIDPLRVIADMEVERASKAGREDRIALWENVLGKLGGVAAGLLIVFSLGHVFRAPTDVAAPILTGNISSEQLYIMSSLLLYFSAYFALYLRRIFPSYLRNPMHQVCK